jgi:photosystem II stability/assembly factor-like uncharacterized protein
MKSSILTALLLGTLLAPSIWPNDWFWQHPTPQGNALRAAARGEELLIAVGDCGTIVRSPVKTRTWQHVPSPTQRHLSAIAFVSAATWVAAGSEGTILRSTDAGLNWTPVESKSKEDFYGLAFGAPDAGIAVGSRGAILFSQDGGQSWVRRMTEVKSTLRAITFLNPREAVAVGESGVILKTESAGTSWKQQEVSGDLYSIVSSGDHLVAVGGEVGYFWNRRVIFRSTNRGDSWKIELSESGPVLYGVSLGPNMTAVACGESGILLQTTSLDSAWTKAKSPARHLLTTVIHTAGGIVALGSFGIVVTSTDGGKNWTANFSEKQKELYSISFFDSDHGVAVGEEGTILYTVNGGATWQTSKSDFKAFLSAVSMLSPAVAVAVGGEGLVLRTVDGGESWKASVTGMDVYLNAVDFVDERSGLAVGYSTILATGDAGISWERRSIPAGVGDCLLWHVAHANKSVVAAVGTTGTILTSSDGGRNWTYRRSGTIRSLQSIAWSDAQHATAVGDRGIVLRTSDGGLTWAETPSGTDQRLTGVVYVNDHEGFAGGENGILLSTSDGGRTWMTDRSHTLNHLSSLFYRAGTSVYAAGWNGTILRRQASQPVEIR